MRQLWTARTCPLGVSSFASRRRRPESRVILPIICCGQRQDALLPASHSAEGALPIPSFESPRQSSIILDLRLDPRQRFALAVAWLCSEGFAAVDATRYPSPDGLMQVDRLLRVFLPNTVCRYTCAITARAPLDF